ncbi:MAG: STAS domain-containing protein [Spirochaetales bacterium]|nr:STAS domain-containing protein [Spirochaetales bacterium]
MDIELEKDGSTMKIIIDGNIDTDGGHELSVQLQEVMEMDDVEHVIFNMTTCRTTISSGIGKLMNFYKYIDAKKGKMEIRGISDSLYTQFMEIHLDRIFPIIRE